MEEHCFLRRYHRTGKLWSWTPWGFVLHHCLVFIIPLTYLQRSDLDTSGWVWGIPRRSTADRNSVSAEVTALVHSGDVLRALRVKYVWCFHIRQLRTCPPNRTTAGEISNALSDCEMQAKEQSLQVETSWGPYQLAFKLSDNPLARNCACGFRSRELNHLARPVAKKPAKLQQSWDLRHFLRPGFSQIQTSPVARSAARITILIMYYPITSNMICI